MADVTDVGGTEPNGDQTSPQGWYFYGITARDDTLADQVKSIHQMAHGEALRVIEAGAVAVVVQPVPLNEFGPETLAARLDDIAWIEAAARRHHDVIAALHQRRALLPARFGAVYPSLEALRSILADMHDTLRAHLERVEGCDEWGMRLYSDRAVLLRSLDAAYPALAELRSELEVAAPGRAYLLRRKLDDACEQAAHESLRALAEDAHNYLICQTRAVQFSPRAHSAQRARSSSTADERAGGEDEVLRADCLVPRADRDAFTGALEAFAAEHQGMRWMCSGPWPPYSFAMPLAGQSDDHSEKGLP